MTHRTTTHDDDILAPHGAADHGEDAEHDDHAHEVEPLGPIDVVTWTYAALGIVLGLVVAAAFAFAAGWIGPG